MKRNLRLAMSIAALAVVPALFAQPDTKNTILTVVIGPEAQFVSVDAGTTLTKVTPGDTKFGPFSGTTNFTYKIRTSQGSGTGAITVQMTAFAPINGPLISDLSYTSTSPSSGTPVGSTAASTASATNVVTFGADAHSSDGGDSGTTIWTLVDRPTTKTTTYTTTATYTVSAS